MHAGFFRTFGGAVWNSMLGSILATIVADCFNRTRETRHADRRLRRQSRHPADARTRRRGIDPIAYGDSTAPIFLVAALWARSHWTWSRRLRTVRS
ncbi:hypothetical protein GTC6_03845 [Gordonia terrae C-6]|uniref:Uncharacterized protein n=1 Tax=Gordonia terrae C-6 TaxID=1316928 RepID=R7YE71_9ACTN|nr:hypothetical protein GTC6_03845 [Gordonia terrae C-6]